MTKQIMNEIWESVLENIMFYILLFGGYLYCNRDRKRRPKE